MENLKIDDKHVRTQTYVTHFALVPTWLFVLYLVWTRAGDKKHEAEMIACNVWLVPLYQEGNLFYIHYESCKPLDRFLTGWFYSLQCCHSPPQPWTIFVIRFSKHDRYEILLQQTTANTKSRCGLIAVIIRRINYIYIHTYIFTYITHSLNGNGTLFLLLVTIRRLQPSTNCVARWTRW